MATIVTRQTGDTSVARPLTNTELDNNFINLNTDLTQLMSFSNYPASKPTLLLDFANTRQLDPRITFTRASVATYYNQLGVMQTAASGVPRFDHNPATDESLGLLIEEQRTNLLTYSAQFDNVAWTKSAGVTVTSNTTVAPDGTVSADTVTADSGLGIYQTVNATVATNYCHSVFIKAGTATSIMLRDDTGAGRHIVVNPTTGAITATSGTLLGSGSQAVGNGWYRYWFAFAADTTSVRLFARPDSAGTAQTFIIWGEQTEVGTATTSATFPTSYIPTVAAQATRAADVAIMTGTNFSSWYNQAEGAMYGEFTLAGLPLTGTNSILRVDDATSSNLITLRCGIVINSGADFYVTSGNTNHVDTAEFTVTPNVFRKYAYAYKTNDFAYVVPDQTPITDIVGVVPTVTQFTFAAGAFNGTLKKIAYYPARVTNTQLQALTS
jgi:hypothetical protein